MKNKGILFVADHATDLQTAKRASVAQRVNRFQHAGFPAAVRANQKVKAGREREIRVFDIAEIFDEETRQRHRVTFPPLQQTQGVIGAASFNADSAQALERTRST
ncbi:hypothetical protein BN131_3174 [Cronobacter malonaticus 681]|nr:hypothetical protein BN131_3174 [Cronobacter malonaticus 681]